MACYGTQAAGVLCSVWWPSLAAFILGSLPLGLPFTAITLFAMQEARRLQPHNASTFIDLLTVAPAIDTRAVEQLFRHKILKLLLSQGRITEAPVALMAE